MSQKQPFNVEFKVLSPGDIQAQQDRQVEDVSAILGEPPEAAAILLRRYRWNKERLIESYMDRPEIVLDTAGLSSDLAQTPETQAVPGFVCEICFEDEAGTQTYAMRCGHRYCVECYQHYLAQKIGQEGEAARIQCPRDGCNRVIDSKTLELLVTPNLKDRYVLWESVGRRRWARGGGGGVGADPMQVRHAPDADIRRRQGEHEVVSGAELRVRRRLRRQEAAAGPDRADGDVLVWALVLLRLRAHRPPALSVHAGPEVVEEVRGRLGDVELDLGEHEGVPKVHLDH